MECINQANASPGQKIASCFNDVLRQSAAAGPVLNTGGWFRNQCGSATADDGADPSTPDQAAKVAAAKQAEKDKLAKAEERKKIDDAAKKDKYDPNKVDMNLQNSGKDIDKAKVLSDADFVAKCGSGSDACTISTQTSNGSDFQIYLKQHAVETLTMESLRGLIEHEVIHEALARADPKSTIQREHDVICHKLGQNGCGNNMCSADAVDCGDCSPLAALGKAYFQCVAPATTPSPFSPLGSLIYPTEDTANSAWSQCFADLDHGLLDPISVSCAVTDCPDGEVPVVGRNGTCVCSANSSSNEPVRVFNACVARIHCGDDVAQSFSVSGSAGYCGCAPVGGALQSEVPVIP